MLIWNLLKKGLIDVKNVLSKVDNIRIKTELRKVVSLKEFEEKILKEIKIKLLTI